MAHKAEKEEEGTGWTLECSATDVLFSVEHSSCTFSEGPSARALDYQASSAAAAAASVGVLPSGSPRGTPRRVVVGRASPRSELDGARNTRI